MIQELQVAQVDFQHVLLGVQAPETMAAIKQMKSMQLFFF